MNVSKPSDPAALLGELERLGAEMDALLRAFEACDSVQAREPILAAIAALLQARGTVVDAFVAWCASPQGKRAMASGRRHWQDALARLRTHDQHRAELLRTMVNRAGEHLRQRIAQQSLLIYQRGAL